MAESIEFEPAFEAEFEHDSPGINIPCEELREEIVILGAVPSRFRLENLGYDTDSADFRQEWGDTRELSSDF